MNAHDFRVFLVASMNLPVICVDVRPVAKGLGNLYLAADPLGRPYLRSTTGTVVAGARAVKLGSGWIECDQGKFRIDPKHMQRVEDVLSSPVLDTLQHHLSRITLPEAALQAYGLAAISQAELDEQSTRHAEQLAAGAACLAALRDENTALRRELDKLEGRIRQMSDAADQNRREVASLRGRLQKAEVESAAAQVLRAMERLGVLASGATNHLCNEVPAARAREQATRGATRGSCMAAEEAAVARHLYLAPATTERTSTFPATLGFDYPPPTPTAPEKAPAKGYWLCIMPGMKTYPTHGEALQAAHRAALDNVGREFLLVSVHNVVKCSKAGDDHTLTW